MNSLQLRFYQKHFEKMTWMLITKIFFVLQTAFQYCNTSEMLWVYRNESVKHASSCHWLNIMCFYFSDVIECLCMFQLCVWFISKIEDWESTSIFFINVTVSLLVFCKFSHMSDWQNSQRQSSFNVFINIEL